MCGIAGIATSADAQLPDLRERLEAMAGAMLHRGPDDGGVYVSPKGRVGLANRRLAIQDLSQAGHMPMSTPDGAVWITYNGEIYNAAELRHELEARGCAFRSHSDTEVILSGYRVWGEDVVQRLRGMFAFGIYDATQRRLFVARDPLGIKPLYYCQQDGVFAFASECGALLRASLAQNSVRPAGLVAYLALGSVPAPFTIYRGIDALEAGHVLTLDLARDTPSMSEPRPYWSLPTTPVQLVTYAEAVEQVHELLLDSVRRHLVSDVPLGAFLSGGIDSGSIVALMREASPSAVIRTCSVTFDEPQFDEGPLARQVAAHFGAEHVDVPIRAEDVSRDLDRVVAFLDQPSNDGINTYFVSRAAHQAGLTVALSGLGGDELFGGYPTFARLPRVLLADAVASRIPGGQAVLTALLTAGGTGQPGTRLADWLSISGGSPTRGYFGLRGLFSPRALRRLVPPDVLAEARAELGMDRLVALAEQHSPEGDAWDLASRLELATYMRHQLLRDTDAMSMAHSLEVRVPFVDHRVVEAVLALPVSVRRGSPPKRLLRDAVPAVPAAIRSRRVKQGFSFPFQPWMRGPLRERVRALAAAALDELGDTVDRRAATAVLDAFDRGEIHWSRAWSLAALATVKRAAPDPVFSPAPSRVHVFDAPTAALVAPGLGRVLGLFPSTERIGGIQTCGRIAWEYLSRPDVSAEGSTAFCFCGDSATARGASTRSEVHVGSKGAAIIAALSRSWDADVILIWHVGLLKLLPFFRRRRARVVVALFGIEAWEPVDFLTSTLLRRADLLISISEYTWQRFVSANPSFASARHETVHLGLGHAPHETPLAPGGPPAAIMISRLDAGERYKGHGEVIGAWPHVQARVPAAQLWIVGDGELRPELERDARSLGLNGSVCFFGTVSEERKRELIQASRCLVLPSRKEGFGLVYLEAMRVARPCLVSDADAGREVVNPPEAGLAVDVADPSALAGGISRLLGDGPEWQAWSAAAARRYASTFTAAQFQTRLVSALGSLRS